MDRVLPAIEAIKQRFDVVVSVDTSQPEVVRAAIAAGADLVNDVRALTREGMEQLVVAHDMPVCLMHMHKTARYHAGRPGYSCNDRGS